MCESKFYVASEEQGLIIYVYIVNKLTSKFALVLRHG